MKLMKSTGEDSLSVQLLKHSLSILLKLLLNIVNTSIVSNTFPATLKVAKIITILITYKNLSLTTSSRPVDLLNSIYKIIEEVIVK